MEYEGGAIFRKVIDVDSMKAPDLYKAVDRWISKTFKNLDKVVKARIENEEIRGEGFESKALLLSECPAARNNFTYSFKVEVKDNRVRCTMYDMRGEMYGIESYVYKKDGTASTGGQAVTVTKSAGGVANALISSLESGIKERKASDW